MRKITYLLMFALVASGAFYIFAADFLAFHPHSLFTIVSIFGHPLGKEFLGIPIFTPHFIIITLRWVMLLLVFYRLFVFIKHQRFLIPQQFQGIWVGVAIIGIIAFILLEISIIFVSTLPTFIWDVLYHNAGYISASLLPLTFTLLEIYSLKNLTHPSSGTGESALR